MRNGRRLSPCSSNCRGGRVLAPLLDVLSRRPRLQNFGYLGRYRYFLTFCTSGRHTAFGSTETITRVADQILRTADESHFAIGAYCFMPDHLHVLTKGMSDAADLRQFAHDAKQRSGYAYKRQTRRRLWQPSYFDRVLRDDAETMLFARYIVENPVADGLVDRIDDYPFWGSPTLGRQQLLEAVRALGPTAEGRLLEREAGV
jgi:putative transposase